MTDYKIFETERLILRPTSVDDAEFILELVNSPSYIKFIGDKKIKTVESAKLHIEEKVLPQLKSLGYSNYTLINKSDNCKIGTCGLYDREGLGVFDIGFAFLPEYQKMGYGFESADKLKNVAFNEFGFTTLSGITSKDNMSSQKLLEKLGMKFIGLTSIPNDNEELLLYRIKI